MESNRQKKIAGVLQSDLANILQGAIRDSGKTGVLVSVTNVKVTVDMSIAKVYISVFPSAFSKQVLEEINASKSQIKHQAAQLTKNQLRRMPELLFFNDDSLDYIDKIDKAVKGQDNPIENPDLLEKRKKS